jgi:cell division septation protein DedD
VRRRLCLLLLSALPAFAAVAQTATTLTAGESRVFPIFNATAAWAVDATIADVTVQQGKVMLFGRSAGRTQIVVGIGDRQETYEVIVVARPGSLSTTGTQGRRRDSGAAEMRYSSAAQEIQASASVTRETKAQRTEVNVRTVAHAGEPAGDRARTSIASASYRIFRSGRELTLLDRDVDHSPLTLAATPIRGIHYLDDHWRLHAGYTSFASYRSFLIPVERQLVAGGGYAVRTSSRSTFTPSLFAVRGEGTIASLLYDYDANRLSASAELAYSHGLGGAASASYDGDRDTLRAALRYRGDDFAVAGTSPRGFFGDASWSHRYGSGSTASIAWSATDVSDTRALTAVADFDHRLNERLSLLGGGTWASFNGDRTLSVPAGLRFDFSRGSAGAIYRHTRSVTNDGGNGIRLFGRVSAGRFYFSAYADRQQNVPTLEVIFSERPDLAFALAELGISAESPADIARALRENALLAELGFVEGVSLELAPSRTQAGFEAAWLGTGASRQQLRLRLLHNVMESVSSRRTTTIGTLSYSRRFAGATDVFASLSYWRTDSEARPFVEVGISRRLDSIPSVFGGTGSITGIVFLDEDLDGVTDGRGVVAEVELDGSRKQRTDASGTFSFKGVPNGSHRVIVRVPDNPEAYFTTPSVTEASTGERIGFGVAMTPARLIGMVKNDAGNGVGGVRLVLARGSQQLVATSASNGEFTFAAAPGEWQLSVLSDSVPAGYSLTGIETRTAVLDRATPLHVEHRLVALRSISGTATPHASILVEPSGKRVAADEQGRFLIRSLPSGPVTLSAGGVTKQVIVPADPAVLDVDLHATATAPAAPVVVTEVFGERRGDLTGYVVQLGAYRVAANATETVRRARQAGVQSRVERTDALHLVIAGPFASRELAAATADRLQNAGIESVIVSRK